MQDGYIFSETVKNNIIIEEDNFDRERYNSSLELSNSLEFIQELPKRHETKIGDDGIHLSKGQIQRILLARAIYKNPKLIFLDEATSALDAKNETEISTKLMNSIGKVTKIIIAHRLSTVKNADNIVVISKGSVVEQGTHKKLLLNKGIYHELVHSQLN